MPGPSRLLGRECHASKEAPRDGKTSQPQHAHAGATQVKTPQAPPLCSRTSNAKAWRQFTVGEAHRRAQAMDHQAVPLVPCVGPFQTHSPKHAASLRLGQTTSPSKTAQHPPLEHMLHMDAAQAGPCHCSSGSAPTHMDILTDSHSGTARLAEAAPCAWAVKRRPSTRLHPKRPSYLPPDHSVPRAARDALATHCHGPLLPPPSSPDRQQFFGRSSWRWERNYGHKFTLQKTVLFPLLRVRSPTEGRAAKKKTCSAHLVGQGDRRAINLLAVPAVHEAQKE